MRQGLAESCRFHRKPINKGNKVWQELGAKHHALRRGEPPPIPLIEATYIQVHLLFEEGRPHSYPLVAHIDFPDEPAWPCDFFEAMYRIPDAGHRLERHAHSLPRRHKAPVNA